MNKKLAGIGLMCAFLVACGGDDTPDAINKRLDLYEAKKPLRE